MPRIYSTKNNLSIDPLLKCIGNEKTEAIQMFLGEELANLMQKRRKVYSPQNYKIKFPWEKIDKLSKSNQQSKYLFLNKLTKNRDGGVGKSSKKKCIFTHTSWYMWNISNQSKRIIIVKTWGNWTKLFFKVIIIVKMLL